MENTNLKSLITLRIEIGKASVTDLKQPDWAKSKNQRDFETQNMSFKKSFVPVANAEILSDLVLSDKNYPLDGLYDVSDNEIVFEVVKVHTGCSSLCDRNICISSGLCKKPRNEDQAFLALHGKKNTPLEETNNEKKEPDLTLDCSDVELSNGKIYYESSWVKEKIKSLQAQLKEEIHIANCQVEISKEKDEEIEHLKAQLSKMEGENFSLAANQCKDGYGDDFGNHQCKLVDHFKREYEDQSIKIKRLEGHIEHLITTKLQEPVKSACDHPRDKRSYIGQNTLKCNVCGHEFS